MNFARAISAFAILLCFSIFIYMNTRYTDDGGTGYEFLALCVLVFGFLLVITGNIANIVLWRFSAVLIALFFAYFATKYYIETDSSFLTRQVTLGTTGGVVFAFLIGLIISQGVSAIYDLRHDTRSDAVLFLMTLAYLVCVLGFASTTLLAHLSLGLDSDRFLVDEAGRGYQRIADLFTMQYLAAAAISSAVLVSSGRKSFQARMALSVPLLLLAAIYAFTSQLVGSNKGLVTPVAIFLVFFAVINATPSTSGTARRTSILNILLSGMVFKLLFVSLFGLGMIAVLGGSLLAYFGLSTDLFRFSGYGSGENTSIESRGRIFDEVFMTHFFYSPMFGNTQVELLTTGKGTYIHSTLSILTHLGVVGFVIFLCVLTAVYLEISTSFRSRFSSIFGNQAYGLFRLLGILAVLVMGMFSAFFTWMPLWFALGLLGNWYHQARFNNQILDRAEPTRRRRRRRKSRSSMRGQEFF